MLRLHSALLLGRKLSPSNHCALERLNKSSRWFSQSICIPTTNNSIIMSHAISLALLLAAIACCWLAQTSHQSHLLQKRHDTVWPEIEEASGDEQSEDEQEDGDARAEEGQSRAWGGQSQIKEGDSFPWFSILFLNPSAKLGDYKRLQDGFTTGYAVEVDHNVFIGHKEAIQRASHRYGSTLVMQGFRELGIHRRFVDPYNEAVWEAPPYGNWRGVVRKLADLTPSFALYHIMKQKYPFAERAAGPGSRKRPEPKLDEWGQPPFDFPVSKWPYAYEYPRLNRDKNLKDNCYMFVMAAPDDGQSKYDFTANRTFARIPVKLERCDGVDCIFRHDESRAQNHTRARICDTYQDVGAPIMCSDKVVPTWNQSEYYQRRYLLLSYIVRWPLQYNYEPFKASCVNGAYAMRVADHVDRIEHEIEELKKAGKW